MNDARLLAAIAAGGLVGSLGRWALGLALPHAGDGFPWGTLTVNLTGALAMGVLVGWLLVRPDAHRFTRPVLGTGVLGGWTTYSALTLDVHTLTTGGDGLGGSGGGGLAVALGYVASSVALGVALCGLGLSLGGRLGGSDGAGDDTGIDGVAGDDVAGGA